MISQPARETLAYDLILFANAFPFFYPPRTRFVLQVESDSGAKRVISEKWCLQTLNESGGRKTGRAPQAA